MNAPVTMKTDLPAASKPRVRVRSGESEPLTRRTIYAGYEGADNTRFRNFYRDRSSQNLLVQKSAVVLRTQARHAYRNHDLARGIVRTAVNNMVGPQGIGVEPQPKNREGEVHTEYRDALLEAWSDWCRRPEVTQRMSWARCQRAMAISRYRDGEVFAQQVVGQVVGLMHGTRVPFSLELFEADFVPMDYSVPAERILQGIGLNTWGRPTALWVYKSEPWKTMQSLARDLKFIPWERVIHWANLEHIGQLRGITEFASILNRLEDIKDYEESERIAAKLAARLTAYVKKGAPEEYENPTDVDGNSLDSDKDREISFDPGTVIDDLIEGEEIGLIDTKRPNPNLITFRGGQLRAAAAGFGTSYSSIAKDYSGTFSSQRQELVEQWVNYAVATDDFVCAVIRPVWETFVQVAHLSGVVPIPSDVRTGTHDDALFIGQSMPWIDPLKEAMGWATLVKMGFASEVEVIRRRGINPWDMLRQVKQWREKCKEQEIGFESNQLGLQELLAIAESGNN